jgi:hypothetical protein
MAARPAGHAGAMDEQPRRSRALRVARVAAPVGAAGVVVAAVLPWTASGTAERTSFATVRTARLLDLGDSALVSAALGGWYFVPALAALTCLGVVIGRDRLAGVPALVVGVAALVLATCVLLAPLGARAGVWLGLVAGATALVAGLRLVAGRR